ncbi:hypothetical protein QQ045_016200 [Rhodiola kirilowii]
MATPEEGEVQSSRSREEQTEHTSWQQSGRLEGVPIEHTESDNAGSAEGDNCLGIKAPVGRIDTDKNEGPGRPAKLTNRRRSLNDAIRSRFGDAGRKRFHPYGGAGSGGRGMVPVNEITQCKEVMEMFEDLSAEAIAQPRRQP